VTAPLRRSCTIASLALAVVGCGDKPPPPRPAAPPAAAAKPAAPVVEAATRPTTVEWTYSSVGKRDPFRSYLADVAAQGNTVALSRCTTPLGRFDLEQLRLVAVITGLEDPVAMVEAPNGTGYALRRGACIGRNGGVIAVVRTGEVVVSEWVVRADGTKDRAQTLLRLPKEAALNIEE
jgi:type IV pilus assembly protein PilP